MIPLPDMTEVDQLKGIHNRLNRLLIENILHTPNILQKKVHLPRDSCDVVNSGVVVSLIVIGTTGHDTVCLCIIRWFSSVLMSSQLS